jgi:hypothetical protein
MIKCSYVLEVKDSKLLSRDLKSLSPANAFAHFVRVIKILGFVRFQNQSLSHFMEGSMGASLLLEPLEALSLTIWRSCLWHN